VSRFCQKMSTLGGSLPLAELPPEVVRVVLGFGRRDLSLLASCAFVCKLFRRLSQPMLRRVIICKACCTELVHARDLCRNDSTSDSIAVSLYSKRFFEDGAPVTLKTGRPALQALLHAAAELDRKGASGLPPSDPFDWFEDAHGRMQGDPCGLSLSDDDFDRADDFLQDSAEEDEALEAIPPDSRPVQLRRTRSLHCKGCKLFIGHVVLGHPEEAGSIDRVFLCKSYIKQADEEGACETDAEAFLFHCSGVRGARSLSGKCGQPLCKRSSVLSYQHCWSPPGSSQIDRAWYINGFCSDSIRVGEAEPRRLAQGLMETADVKCSKCEGFVGWKFVKDLDRGRQNRNQVGRFGICTSSILELQDARHRRTLHRRLHYVSAGVGAPQTPASSEDMLDEEGSE